MIQLPCKRMTVTAIGVSLDLRTEIATNYHLPDKPCTEEPGNCGAVHAEDALLRKMPHPHTVTVTHSPCLACARLLVEHDVRLVVYEKPYRLRDGLDYLRQNGVKVVQLT